MRVWWGSARAAPKGRRIPTLPRTQSEEPGIAQMRDDLTAMEKRPFDGLIFRLSGGHNAFVTKPLESASFAEDERILRSMRPLHAPC